MNKVLAVVDNEPTMKYIQQCSNIPDILTFSNLEIDIREQTVYYNNALVVLTHHEFFTLLYLAQHPKWAFSKEQIYEAVWKESGGNCEGAVTNIISQLRHKLNPDNPKEGYIRTVVNSGYRFEA